jgi:hypothetical protein
MGSVCWASASLFDHFRIKIQEILMSTTTYRNKALTNPLKSLSMRRGSLFGFLILVALLSFEIFNYSTTDYALGDLLGDLRFLGVRWATILAIAFCGIDFAGIARLFTPEKGADEPAEVWYLFGAWLLAAAMNAALTWWGVAIAITNQSHLSSTVIDQQTLTKVVPVFVAVLVWLIRILIIGTFSVAGEKLLWQDDSAYDRRRYSEQPSNGYQRPATNLTRPTAAPIASFRPAPKNQPARDDHGYSRPEPSYQPMNARPKAGSQQTRY